MKYSEKNKESIIDEFYNEDFGKTTNLNKLSDEYAAFKEKLQSADDKLLLLENECLDFEIDLDGMINKAIEIKTRKKSNIEFLLFLILSGIILSIYGVLIITLGVKVFITSQIILTSTLPWCLIPISILKVRESDL